MGAVMKTVVPFHDATVGKTRPIGSRFSVGDERADELERASVAEIVMLSDEIEADPVDETTENGGEAAGSVDETTENGGETAGNVGEEGDDGKSELAKDRESLRADADESADMTKRQPAKRQRRASTKKNVG